MPERAVAARARPVNAVSSYDGQCSGSIVTLGTGGAGACSFVPASTLDVMGDRDDLRKFITELAVVQGHVVLSSGRDADWHIDLRHEPLHHAAARRLRGVRGGQGARIVTTGRGAGRVRLPSSGVAGNTSTTSGNVLTAVEALQRQGPKLSVLR